MLQNEEEEAKNTEGLPTEEQKNAESMNDKDMVISKLQLNTKRIDKILDEMGNILDEIENTPLKADEKKYLLSVYRENLDNIGRNIRFQISNMSKWASIYCICTYLMWSNFILYVVKLHTLCCILIYLYVFVVKLAFM